MTYNIKCLGTVANENILEDTESLVNGALHKLRFIDSAVADNNILFPPAPAGLETYDTATGALVVHASAAEAFEGLVTNGDFRDGTTGWTANDSAIITELDGVLKIENGAASAGDGYEAIPTVIGVTYLVEAIIAAGLQPARLIVSDLLSGSEHGALQVSATVPELVTVSFTATSTTTHIRFSPASATLGDTMFAYSVSLMPVTESVITSRKDFGLIEVWHEKISDKGVVFPGGNPQYGATTWNGIALSNTLVAQGYFAFNESDTVTKGYGVTLATLSDADKLLFIKDKDNKIYLDDGELIQIRFRMRTPKGFGDVWDRIDPNQDSSGSAMGYIDSTEGDISVRGSRITSEDFGRFSNSNSGRFHDRWNAFEPQQGHFRATAPAGPYDEYSSTAAYKGRCFAIPLALVQRRNQGMYHHEHNSNGTKKAVDGLFWYNTTISFNSKADCFDPAKLLTASGTIASGVSGRPHDGKFFDAIYATDVKDLRMSTKLLPREEVRKKARSMAVAGTARGFEAVPFTEFWTETTDSGSQSNEGRVLRILSTSSNTIENAGWFNASIGDSWYVLDTSQLITVIGVTSSQITFDDIPATRLADRVWMVVNKARNTHHQASPSWTDIIGDPADIAIVWPNEVEGQWIPVIPDGTSKTFNYNRKVVGNFGGSNSEFTDSNGSSWISISGWGDSSTLNSRTSGVTAGGVYLIHYKTKAHFTEDSVNKKVLDLGGVSATESSSDESAVFVSSVIGKVATGSSDPNKVQQTLLSHFEDSDGKLETIAAYAPKHNSINISHNNDSPAVKTLDYLAETNGVLELVYAYKEMIYDVDWGDNSQFEIIDNQSTQVDDNGNIIKYGTASFKTQYFNVEN